MFGVMKDTISNIKNLRLLMWLRSMAIIGQALAITVVSAFLDIPLHEKPLWGILGILVFVNILTFFRIRTAVHISQWEFCGQLLMDITALFFLLYFTGGATNPFASLFILQVIIAAVVLPPFYTWNVAALTVILYTILMFWKVDVPYFMHHHIGTFFTLHVQGMWISFMVLAGIVAWFVVRMHQTIYRQNSLLQEAEKIAALGAFATNAAHELGTPLATLAILSEGLDDGYKQKFSEQIIRCKDIISRIAMAGGAGRAEGGSKMLLEAFLKDAVNSWHKTQPDAGLQTIIAGKDNPKIVAEESVKHAFFNLLDNAFDASPDYILFNAKWTSQRLDIHIIDKGNGLDKQIEASLGEVGISTKEKGFGLGVFLAKNSISRLGGELTIENTSEGGVVCHISLPLKELML